MKEKPSDYIYEELKNEIMLLELLPGQGISEVEIAKRFNVSRTPIRDVFKQLAAEGLLEIIPQKGTFVSLIDLSYISDLMYLREKIEISILKDIADQITESQLFKLKLTLMKQKKLLSRGQDELEGISLAKSFILTDNEFHRSFFNIANKESLWKLMAQTRPHYHRFRLLINMKNVETLKRLYEDHQRILQYLISKDIEGLEKTYHGHLYNGIDGIDEVIEEYEAYFEVE